jgi:hypothetical protein
MLALGYLHAVFPLRVRHHLEESELPPSPLNPSATLMNGNRFNQSLGEQLLKPEFGFQYSLCVLLFIP